MDFKDILKELRKSRGYTHNELANRLNVSSGIIGMYESGSRRPSYEMLEVLADFFNVDIDYLTGRSERSTYYENPEVAQMAQELYDRPEMRLLFKAAKDTKKEDIEAVIEILRRFGKGD